ncbi:hypothetical protein F9L69_07390 [Brucella melitensis]|uniref:Uncharacterized protein n=4 Tax=Brucella TaxID=234 RepID=Q8YEE9_BRUME|nr:hypothetical protein BMEI1929 [Brucella melitensis bv. 1 str. 16M]AQQ56415.1 hypothetical protein ADS42_004600 [Brucella melitensis]EEX89673.1 predicted protein [Brucella ceti M13/05/1]EEX97320.1 predicted protein [Brucella ceti M644/93/1]EEX99392.1 predicted protein [Brucella pinnipedialis B2/94]EEY07288.1 predicted protein [Brucella pinnipedialis M163/99/10]EEY27110.1 predicted protein [Brucella sp. F5/99]EEY29017.1 predicted protein [Brucella suis bv. 5 str. 513]RTQ42511.1 hypothetica
MVAAKATLDRSFRFILFLLWWGGIVRTAPKQPMPVNFQRLRAAELPGPPFCSSRDLKGSIQKRPLCSSKRPEP